MKAEMLAQTQKRGRGLGDGGGNGPVAQLFHGYIWITIELLELE